MSILQKMNNKRRITIFIIICLILAGVFLKCYYVRQTETWIRQHDVIGFGADEGHAPYIEYILNNKKLPDFDPTTRWAFFQPPLHHIISAVTMKISYAFGASDKRAQENTQVPTCIYMIVLTFLSAYMFLKAKGLGRLSDSDFKNKSLSAGMVTLLAVIGLHPMFILLAGSINNDTLGLFLSVVALVIGCAFYENASLINTVCLALVIGLAMISKLTGGLVAVPIAILMVIKFFGLAGTLTVTKKGKASTDSATDKPGIGYFIKNYLFKASLFAVIVFPLGLSYSIYNKIRWGIPINYIPAVGERFPETVTMSGRLFDVTTGSVYTYVTTRGDSYDEYNIPLMIIKTSLFGDYNYSDVSRWMSPLSLILFVSALVLIVVAIIATVNITFSKTSKTPLQWRIALFGTYTVYLLAYLYFALSHRNFSAGDFRYAAICIVCEGIYTGLFVDKLKNNKIRYAISAVALVFAASAFMIYGLLAYKS